MKHTIYILFCACVMLLGCVSLHADDDCDLALQEAREALDDGNYQKAKDLCNYVIVVCGSSYGNVSSLMADVKDAMSPKLTLSRTSLSVGPSATTEYITVSSNRPWKIKFGSGAMYSVTRSGNQLVVKINENTTSSSRTDYFKIVTEDGNKEVKVSLSQSAPRRSQSTGTSNSGASNRSTSSSSSYSSAHTPSATIHDVWVEHNKYEGGEKGMRIHIKMEVVNLNAKKCRAIAYFYDSNSNPLVDRNDSYRTTDGKVSVGKDFTPSYDNSTFSDFTMFMPYSELHVSYKSTIRFFVTLWNKSVSPNKELTDSNWMSFTYTPSSY